MNGSAEFEVAAKSDFKVFESAFFAVYGQKVGQGLRGVIMSAVARVDKRYGTVSCPDYRRALFRVSHGNYVGVTADDFKSIGNAFAL